MSKSERIWLVIGFAALAALIMLEVRRVHTATLASQGQFGTPDSTNATAPGQIQGAPNEDQIAADVGPWYLYYNTPGVYAFGPPLVNTMAPPNLAAPASAANGGCSTCH